MSAPRGLTSPVTMGRWPVRTMSLSMSRSRNMLSALAPPAARKPPTSVTATSRSEGRPCEARIIVGTVVTSSSSMMRGFVSATYAAALERRRPSESAPATAGRGTTAVTRTLPGDDRWMPGAPGR